MNTIEVTRTYLQMLDPDMLVPFRLDDERVRIEQVFNCPVSFFRFLYAEVGQNYHWTDRLAWTDEQVREYLEQPEITFWAMFSDGAPSGYFELRRCGDGSTEVAYFGLLPGFLGRGMGKHLLTRAVDEAWAAGANRVWLHTCTLDDPAALPNYLKRGFQPFKQETYTIQK